MPDIHDLVGPYALGALEGAERRRFERHLEDCRICVPELPGLQSAAAALALDVHAAEPRPALRRRVVEAARAERAKATRPRLSPSWGHPRRLRAAAALAVAVACAAIGLGVWVARLANELDRETAVHRADARAIAVLADPGASRFRLRGADGVLAVTADRDAALLVTQLPRAGDGLTYELWVVKGAQPLPAGIFPGGGARSLVALERTVPAGAHVSVSLEAEGGSATLTGPILFGTGVT